MKEKMSELLWLVSGQVFEFYGFEDASLHFSKACKKS
jgi:hypothetical protein